MRCNATLLKTAAPASATLGPMDTIATWKRLILLEGAILGVFTAAAYLMVALFLG